MAWWLAVIAAAAWAIERHAAERDATSWRDLYFRTRYPRVVPGLAPDRPWERN